MTIRWALGLRSGFSRGLNRLRAGTRGGWLAIALELSLVPEFLLAQIIPGTASQPAGSSTSPRADSAAPSSIGASVPAGYIFSPNDQGSIDVFGEDDLR